jgi:hypothetical protein
MVIDPILFGITLKQLGNTNFLSPFTLPISDLYNSQHLFDFSIDFNSSHYDGESVRLDLKVNIS